MSGQAIENVSIRQLLPFNPSNGQVPVWNSTTQRWDAGAAGGFDIAANYSPTGLWNFTQVPQVGGIPLATTATVAGLGNVLKLGAALDTTLRSVTDQAGTASPLQLSTTQVGITTNLTVGDSLGGNASIVTEGNAGVFHQLLRYSNNSTRPRTEYYKARGNKVTPLVINIGDELGSLDFYGYTGSAFTRNAILYTRAKDVTAGVITADFSIGLGVSAAANDYITTFSTLGVVISANSTSITPTARLHVRGDGTNPIFRGESSAGTNGWTINSTGLDFLPIVTNVNSLGGVSNRINNIYVNTIYGGASNNFSINLIAGGFSGSFRVNQNYDYNSQKGTWMFDQTIYGVQVNNATSGTGAHIYGCYTFKPSATSTANPRALWLEYDLNRNGQTVSGTATGIMVNATETDITGMTHNLMDLQVGGVSRVKIGNSGNITAVNTIQAPDFALVAGQSAISSSSGIILFTTNYTGTFTGLRLGGTGTGNPMIKRNGAAIDFRLADDSGYAAINSGSISCTSNLGVTTSMSLGGSAVFGLNDLGTLTASAVLEARSTTKGFLPPRMTTANKTAISSPATGLVLYDTDLATLAVYTSSWKNVLLNATAIAVTSVTANSYAFTTGGFTINASFSNEIGLGSLLATSPALNVATANTLKIVAASGVGTFQFLQAKLQTDTNFVSSGLETCTGYLTLYDALGVAYKVMVSGTA